MQTLAFLLDLFWKKTAKFSLIEPTMSINVYHGEKLVELIFLCVSKHCRLICLQLIESFIQNIKLNSGHALTT